jgi:pimeloyl-ACP methyl ester carboxylesterase
VRLRWILVVVLVAALAAAVLWRPWVGAQARAFVVLSTTLQTPVLGWTARALTRDPHVAETVVAGAPTTVVWPAQAGPWRTLVFANGATELGRHHPDVQRLARGLARAGYLVLVPDLPGLRRGEISLQTLHATVAVARAVTRWQAVRERRVGFVSVSVGASLALLAAEDPELADRVTVVAGIAPYTDLVDVTRLATTGTYLDRGRLRPYDPGPFLRLAVARSLAAGLRSGPDRRALLARLASVPNDDPTPLRTLRERPLRRLGPGGRAVLAVLLNRDPRRFDRLFARLSPPLRLTLRRLSPLTGAGRLRARVELATSPHDTYFPTAESRELARRSPSVEVTVTRTLLHAIPKPSPRDLLDLLRLDGWAVRALRYAGS